MQDRRKHPRYPYNESIFIKLCSVAGMEDLDGQGLLCKTADISEGGIAFRIDREIPIQTAIEMRIELKSPPTTFIHQGKVRWVREIDPINGFHIGVEFTSTAPQVLEIWRTLVEQIKAEASKVE
jgi:hypothetical protein